MQVDEPGVDDAIQSLLDEIERQCQQLQQVDDEPAHDEAEHKYKQHGFPLLEPPKYPSRGGGRHGATCGVREPPRELQIIRGRTLNGSSGSATLAVQCRRLLGFQLSCRHVEGLHKSPGNRSCGAALLTA